MKLEQAKATFKQVCLWGHKLNSHTHSFIHYAFERAFRLLGFKTLWLDNSDKIDPYDFSETLFITEGQVDQRIPIRRDCWYVIHNCDQIKYLAVQDRVVGLQVFTRDVDGRCNRSIGSFRKTKPYHYVETGNNWSLVYQPWATDLMPDEIDLAWSRARGERTANGSVQKSQGIDCTETTFS